MNVFKRYIYVSFHGGKAFMESRPGLGEDSTLSLNINFNGQRFNGKTVLACSEPSFTEGFLLELPGSLSAGLGAVLTDSFLIYTEPVHITIVRHDSNGDFVLTGSHFLDWRQHVLRALESSTGSFQAVEVMGVGAACSVPTGIVNVRVDVLPAPAASLNPDVARTHLSLERARVVDAERIFFVYAKQWWREVIFAALSFLYLN
jgi:centrosomal protein CEP76